MCELLDSGSKTQDPTIGIVDQHHKHIRKVVENLVNENAELASENLRLKGEINELLELIKYNSRIKDARFL